MASNKRSLLSNRNDFVRHAQKGGSWPSFTIRGRIAALSGDAQRKDSPTMIRNKAVKVRVTHFEALLASQRMPLALDNYQRPYVWGKEKVQQLLKDLHEFKLEMANGLDYYMGALLIHQDRAKNRQFVIDGQQRLTTLCILYHVLHGTLPTGADFAYRSPESVNNIQQAQRIIEAEGLTNDCKALFRRIMFSVITVPNEDLAFTFFDNQNSRGVPLGAADLLKAFHLRAIEGEHREKLQARFAGRWEHWQKHDHCQGIAGDFDELLFGKLLWRGRRWRGQKALQEESRDGVINEFQANTLRPDQGNRLDISPAPLAYASAQLLVSRAGNLRLSRGALPEPDDIAALPFSLRQPIQRGLGFFLYVEKYAALVNQLFGISTQERAFRQFYSAVTLRLSPYLRELFCLAVVMFVDRFGTRDLLRFALSLDFVIGAIRIEKSYIFAAAVTVYLRDASLNLLDVIAQAYTPDEVIGFLMSDPRAAAIYAAEEIQTDSTVRGRYKAAVLAFYGKEGKLAGREAWIREQCA
ncbi:GmrSD restriction endonuclease domain-containing protein [Pseudomonas fragi]|uniref:DUF262 domain-containing protein n=1 Tax=Pseudomonas fragi TaxID=296 RepID=UPI001474DA98|nr:DUF262 domain-containing protein [Pseudomonas fragi]